MCSSECGLTVYVQSCVSVWMSVYYECSTSWQNPKLRYFWPNTLTLNYTVCCCSQQSPRRDECDIILDRLVGKENNILQENTESLRQHKQFFKRDCKKDRKKASVSLLMLRWINKLYTHEKFVTKILKKIINWYELGGNTFLWIYCNSSSMTCVIMCMHLWSRLCVSQHGCLNVLVRCLF